MAAILLYSPKSSSLSSLGSFDNLQAVEANEAILLKLLARSPYGEMVGVSTAQLCVAQGPFSVAFVEVLHVLRDIFMEQVITEDDNKLAGNKLDAMASSTTTMTMSASTATSTVTSATATAASTATATSGASHGNTTVTTATKSDAKAVATTPRKAKKTNSWLLVEEESDASLSSDDEDAFSRQLVHFQSTYRQVSALYCITMLKLSSLLELNILPIRPIVMYSHVH